MEVEKQPKFFQPYGYLEDMIRKMREGKEERDAYNVWATKYNNIKDLLDKRYINRKKLLYVVTLFAVIFFVIVFITGQNLIIPNITLLLIGAFYGLNYWKRKKELDSLLKYREEMPEVDKSKLYNKHVKKLIEDIRGEFLGINPRVFYEDGTKYVFKLVCDSELFSWFCVYDKLHEDGNKGLLIKEDVYLNEEFHEVWDKLIEYELTYNCNTDNLTTNFKIEHNDVYKDWMELYKRFKELGGIKNYVNTIIED